MTKATITRYHGYDRESVPCVDEPFSGRSLCSVNCWNYVKRSVVNSQFSCPRGSVGIHDLNDVLPRGELWSQPREKYVTIGMVVSVVRPAVSDVRYFDPRRTGVVSQAIFIGVIVIIERNRASVSRNVRRHEDPVA